MGGYIARYVQITHILALIIAMSRVTQIYLNIL
jgi:hypothetical protein